MSLFRATRVFRPSFLALNASTRFVACRSFSGSFARVGAAASASAPSKPVGMIPTNEEVVTGVEKMEAEGKIHDDEILYGKFGTKESPVVVESHFDSRIVGCLGGPDEKHTHELLWHEVKVGKPTVCLECGQYFTLKKIAGSDHGHGGHGHH